MTRFLLTATTAFVLAVFVYMRNVEPVPHPDESDPVAYGEYLAENTLMNRSAFAGMTDEDLGAIYEFLRTLPPVTSAEGSSRVPRVRYPRRTRWPSRAS